MTRTQSLACTCGQVRLAVERAPILSAECCCASCREAGERLAALPGAAPVLGPHGTTRFILYRKDRAHIVKGAALLKNFRLTPTSKTRRVVASCCNAPVFLEFSGGHWLSLYGNLWPEGALPPLEMRTMASDLPDPSVLPDDVPNARRQSLSFFAKLLAAWAAMRFRNPRVSVHGEIHA